MSTLGNLSVMGDSEISGGRFQKVKVMGNLTAHAPIDGHAVKVMGNVESESDVTCDEISVMGNMNLKNLSVRSNGSIMGKIVAKEIRAERFDVKGEVACEKDMSCGKLEIRGCVDVGNLLNAEILVVKAKFHSKAKEVGGKSITVQCPLFYDKTVLTADVIEFDEIDVSNVEAKVLRGVRVMIGKNCKIDRVEYKEFLQKHPDAQVKQAIKLE